MDPTSTTTLLLERLQAWKHVCGYLQNYIAATEKIQKAQAKEYEMVLKTVSDPLKEGYQFDQALGGVVGLFGNLRSNIQGIANLHLQTEQNLKSEVLPILEHLHQEIKSKLQELADSIGKSSKSVDKARNTTQKHIELLGQHVASYGASAGKIDAISDPYVLQRGICYRFNKQILEENNFRKDLIAAQSSFPQFETHVIQTFQQALQSFGQFVGGQAQRENEIYSNMVSTVQQVPGSFEWDSFQRRNKTLLVDPNVLPRSVNDITFPNQNHSATKPLIEGILERKSSGMGMLKGYNSSYYVVTSCKYLHEFKDDDKFRKDPTPDLTLYLPDCTLGAVDGTKFSIKGKDVTKNKVGTAALHANHALTFKAHSLSDAKKWWTFLGDAAGRMTQELPLKSEPNSPLGEPNSPTFSQNVNGIRAMAIGEK